MPSSIPPTPATRSSGPSKPPPSIPKSANSKRESCRPDMENVKVVECPRDAWQGLPDIIPTECKAEYLKELIAAGFKYIDAVSFVSPKYVKQMADSEEVMAKLNASLPPGVELPEIIGIVVNEKGLERALATPGVTTI